MAQKFILLFVLWLVVAIFTTSARATGNSTTAAAGNSTTAATGNSTTAAAGNSTTAATGNSTTAAASNSTTAAAGYSTTAPAGNSTTAAAGNSTTAAASNSTTAAGSNSTTAAAGNSTTAATGNSTTAATGNSTTATPTTQFKDPCNSNPCGTGSTCEVRYNDTYVCLCLAGDFYNNVSKSCERSKVFPGKLQLNKDFNEKMRDRTSKEFKETADTIIAEVDNVYNGKNGYFGCIVLKLLPSTTSRSRNTALKVDAVVDITFKASAEIKEADVIQALKECRNCNTIGKTFETKNLCDDTPCDEKNTNCTSSDGTFSCTCKEGYMQTDYSNRMCIACPLGEKLKDNLCVKCSFGYSGFNCSENWQLILVIVGSVLGGLLLIAIILLPVVATQKSNKISKKSKSAEMEKPYTGLSSATQPMASNKLGHSQGLSFNRSANGDSGFQNDGVSMFPRAGNPTNSMDNRTNLEMKPSNGRQNLGHMNSGSEYSSRIYDEPEDIRPYAQTRPQNNPYAENQPRMNPYTQNQPRMNPYTQNQGHSNPYHTHDDGRRYY